MAITNKEQGVWILDEVFAKQNEGDIWGYDSDVYELFIWGNNSKGMLGLNDTNQRSSPIQIPGTTWVRVPQGNYESDDYQTGAVNSSNELWVWGDNTNGQLGLNNKTQYSSPTQVPGTTWSNGVWFSNNCAFWTKTDGSLWSWGSNNYGQLGQNNKTQYSSPKQVGTDTTWGTGDGKIGSWSQAAIAIKTDGTLWSWGRNNDKKITSASPDNTHISSPRQVGTDTDWEKVSSGGSSAFLIKTDGTLWAQGHNEYGTLGMNSNTNQSSPIQIPGTTWATVAVAGQSGSNVIATKTDGTLWSWGQNDSGSLGLNQGEPAQRSSPAQVPGTTWTTNWASIRRGNKYNAMASKTDGTLWIWGTNSSGQFGTGEGYYVVSSPLQIPGNWGTPKVSFFAAGVIALKQA